MLRRTLIIGTRASALALCQAETVIASLRAANPNFEFRIEPMSTRGDRVQDRPVSALGDKGVFVRPMQDALLAGSIDIAVHSLKDVPADLKVPGLNLTAFPERADPRDVVVSPYYRSLAALPVAARVGTGSPRRRWLLHRERPDLLVLPIRGNVDTRLRKLEAGEYDAIVLAAAGLQRLGLSDHIREYLDPNWFVPDACQGILAVETRESGAGHDAAQRIDDPAVRIVALLERAVVQQMGADCHTPVGAYACCQGDEVWIVASAPGSGTPLKTRISLAGGYDSAVNAAGVVGERLREMMA